MRGHPALLITFICLILCATLAFVGCGGGHHSAPVAPVFTSNPPTSAAEGSLYTYTVAATDPAGGSVTFALSSAPAGASLSGSALSWTPAWVESRVSDGFTITATTSEGGRATQSWGVTPAGTIHGSFIYTRWTTSGASDEPFDWVSRRTVPQALIPQPDGSVTPIPGTGNADGTFMIPGVPGGYYWLQMGKESYWTSSSTFDLGLDYVGQALTTIPTTEQTIFDFNIQGLDPVVPGDQFAFLLDWAKISDVMNIGFAIQEPAGSTTLTATYMSPHTNIDYASAKTGFLLQYEPVSVGSLTGVVLGPELTVPNLSLVSGATNNIDDTLNASPRASFDLSVKGSQWAPMFQNAAPGTVTPISTYIAMYAQPYAPASVMGVPLNLPLFLPPLHANQGFLVGWPTAGTCGGQVQINPQTIITSYPPMLTDQDFGVLNYGDPFDAAWARVFSLCQTATVEVPAPGGASPALFVFEDGVNSRIPSGPVAPLAMPAVNPTINGTSFFTSNTVSPSGVTLSWVEPGGTKPFAYKLWVLMWKTLPDGSLGYEEVSTWYTGKTSITVPTLLDGQTYVFVLTTQVDGRANVESSPRRSGLPTGAAIVVSAPIATISATRELGR